MSQSVDPKLDEVAQDIGPERDRGGPKHRPRSTGLDGRNGQCCEPSNKNKIAEGAPHPENHESVVRIAAPTDQRCQDGEIGRVVVAEVIVWPQSLRGQPDLMGAEYFVVIIAPMEDTDSPCQSPHGEKTGKRRAADDTREPPLPFEVIGCDASSRLGTRPVGRNRTGQFQGASQGRGVNVATDLNRSLGAGQPIVPSPPSEVSLQPPRSHDARIRGRLRWMHVKVDCNIRTLPSNPLGRR
jgi:hypothetical protein